MADAIPTPTDRQAPIQSTVVVQQPMSQWSALKEAGWWTPFDTAICGLIFVLWLTVFYWRLFGQPTGMGMIAALLINLNITILWAIVLVYRCSWFVLRLNADVATLPTEAARIAVAFLAGKTPPSKNTQ